MTLRSLLFSVLTPALAAVLLVGCGGDPTKAGAEPLPTEATVASQAPPEARRGEAVRTTTVRTAPVDAVITASGSVAAPRTTDLGPEVAGRLIDVPVDVGDEVGEGDVVFRLDPEPFRIQLEDAEAGLELAKAEAEQERAEVERALRLSDQEILARQELEQRRTRLAVAEARVEQAKARLRRAARELDRATVRAPYPGSVVARHLHEGAMVSPGPMSAVVVTLQESTGFEAVIDVPEAAPVAAERGDRASLIVEGVPEPIETEVERVNARIDEESRTYEVRAPIPRGSKVKAGSFVRAEITPSEQRLTTVIERDAVRTRDGRSIAFQIENGRAVETRLRLGATGRVLVEVLEGLEVGAEVIVGEVVDRLADGSPVDRVAIEPEPVIVPGAGS
ncbi:MAG: efflux RND transporter periplasmic adaptor subunit [Thermoanaerobaculia bacterium]|nr:efflux RND transporter periplasmic adaptor subunit [Thermoanaerobaculia bacterium]